MLKASLKICLLLLFLFFFLNCSSYKAKYNCNDTKACIEFERQLRFIADCNFYRINIKDENLTNAIDFLERLTGHKYNTDMKIDDRLPTKVNGYFNWTAWYSINYNKLQYDKKNKTVILINEGN